MPFTQYSFLPKQQISGLVKQVVRVALVELSRYSARAGLRSWVVVGRSVHCIKRKARHTVCQFRYLNSSQGRELLHRRCQRCLQRNAPSFLSFQAKRAMKSSSVLLGDFGPHNFALRASRELWERTLDTRAVTSGIQPTGT
jgi:hypothetical protein